MPDFENDDGTWITRLRAAEPSEHHVTEIAEVFVDGSVFQEMQYSNDKDYPENGISRTQAKTWESKMEEPDETVLNDRIQNPNSDHTTKAKDRPPSLNVGFKETEHIPKTFYSCYVLQRDVLDDGEPPKPRAGWPIRHLKLFCLIQELDHLPQDTSSNRVPYFFIEVRVGDHVYKTQVCEGDTSRMGYVKFYQLIKAQIDDEILQAVSQSMSDASKICPCLTVTCFDCGRRFKNHVVGRVVFSLADLLEINNEGWHELRCNFIDSEGQDVVGDNQVTTLCMAVHLDERCKVKWKPPSLKETLRVCEGPLTLQSSGRRKLGSVSHAVRGLSRDGAIAESQHGTSFFDSSLHGSVAPSRISDDLLQSGIDVEDLDEDENPDQRIIYWKEELEKWLDGIIVQLVIISLVVLDVTILIIFAMILQSGDSEASLNTSSAEADVAAAAVTIIILACFLLELSLRQVAKGLRFWMDRWCIFDFVVIWLSVAMAVIKYILAATQGGGANDDLQTANSSTNALRILSRVAVGLRVVRILTNLRHARKLSGKVQVKLRGIVSQNRRRFLKHGFDLDATYITSRIIAMSAPSFGSHSAYRNDIHVVSRFLAYMHYGRFFVFNLCDIYYSSDRLIGQYHPSMLFHQVQRIPVEDHCPPLLVEVVRFCEDATQWMLQDHKNVIAAHCKGGKGRTGVFISALLVWSGHRRTALDALELFTFRRSDPYDPELGIDSSLSHGIAVKRCNQTVEGPSQIRYVHYAEALLYNCINPFSNPKVALLDVGFRVGPTMRRHPWNISFTVSCLRAPILDSRNVSHSLIPLGGSGDDDFIIFPLNSTVWGDVRLDFYKHQSSRPYSKKKLVFFLVFHTSFYTGEISLEFGKKKLDVLCKDNKGRLTDSNFEVDLRISYDPNANELMRQEDKFKALVMRQGTKFTYTTGQTIIRANENQGAVLLIISGAVEGVVDEGTGTGPHHSHPLGKSIPAPWSSGTCSSFGAPSAALGGKHTERVPNICLLGPGSVLETGLLGIGADNMEFRARSPVELLRLSRHQKTTRGSRLWHSLQEHLGLATQPDYAISGLALTEMPSFFRGYAISLATQLSCIQADVIRIGGLRAFSDRQTVMIAIDEDENLRKSCIRQFALPMNERLLLKARCFYKKGQGGKGTKMRLILLGNYIVLDPGFFGPSISTNAELIPCNQLFSVSPPHAANQVSTASEAEITDSGLKLGSGAGMERLEKTILNITTFLECSVGKGSTTTTSGRNILTAEYTLTLDDVSLTRQVYAVLSGLCQLGEHIRHRDAEPFLSALAGGDFGGDAEEVAVSHVLNLAQKLDAASNVDSLFQVRAGEIKLRLRSTGEVFQVVRRGQVFGLLGLTLRAMPGHYYAEASLAATEVLELRHDLLDKWLEGSPRAFSRFYRAICRELAKDRVTCLKDAFPGTWCQHQLQEEAVLANIRPQSPTADIRRSMTCGANRFSMARGEARGGGWPAGPRGSSELPSPRQYRSKATRELDGILHDDFSLGPAANTVRVGLGDDALPWESSLSPKGSRSNESGESRRASSSGDGPEDPMLFSRRTNGIQEAHVQGVGADDADQGGRDEPDTQRSESETPVSRLAAPMMAGYCGGPGTNGDHGEKISSRAELAVSRSPGVPAGAGMMGPSRGAEEGSGVYCRGEGRWDGDGRECSAGPGEATSEADFGECPGADPGGVTAAMQDRDRGPGDAARDGLVWVVDDVWT